MKIKLIQAGYENFTGIFGNHAFQDGVSEDLSKEVFESMSATIGCEAIAEQGSFKEVVLTPPVIEPVIEPVVEPVPEPTVEAVAEPELEPAVVEEVPAV